ncbi:MAG: hypothetical protein AUK63_2273 [bacterium P3]|nr:MAG: hypothetical protein AUK63_2273 [bacterium P3]
MFFSTPSTVTLLFIQVTLDILMEPVAVSIAPTSTSCQGSTVKVSSSPLSTTSMLKL